MDKKQFYWELLQHEDNLFTNRSNLLIVVESIFIAAIATLYSDMNKVLLFAFCGLALLITLVWLYINFLHMSKVQPAVKIALKKHHPYWSKYARIKGATRTHFLLGIIIPALFAIFWTGLIVYINCH